MTEKKTTPLRERLIEDMRIHGMDDKARKAHIRAIKDFAGFLKRSPDMATPDDLRAYHRSDKAETATKRNSQAISIAPVISPVTSSGDVSPTGLSATLVPRRKTTTRSQTANTSGIL